MTADGAEALLDAADGSLVVRLPFRPFSSVHAEVCTRETTIAWQHKAQQHSRELKSHYVPQMRQKGTGGALSS